MAITYQNRKDYVENVTRLSLWLIDKYCSDTFTFEFLITSKTPIYRLTTLWDGVNNPAVPVDGWKDEKWNNIVAILKDIYKKKADFRSFEDESLKLLWPILEQRIEVDVKAWPALPSVYGFNYPKENAFGFFQYDISYDDWFGLETPLLYIHLGNICSPESPFIDIKSRINELNKLLDSACLKHPNLKYTVCGTWLNSFKPFTAFFPDEWLETGEHDSKLKEFKNSRRIQPNSFDFIDSISYGYGSWGQMMTRYGSFHYKNGEYFRKTGFFPYPGDDGFCTIRSLRNHLSKRLKEFDS